MKKIIIYIALVVVAIIILASYNTKPAVDVNIRTNPNVCVMTVVNSCHYIVFMGDNKGGICHAGNCPNH